MSANDVIKVHRDYIYIDNSVLSLRSQMSQVLTQVLELSYIPSPPTLHHPYISEIPVLCLRKVEKANEQPRRSKRILSKRRAKRVRFEI